MKDPIEDIISFVYDSCGPLRIPDSNDMAYNHIGAIKVGWGTVRDLGSGSAVLGHELGHRLDNIFKSIKMSGKSQERYNEIRACLTKGHSEGEGKIKGQYLDEDWGDFVAAESSDKNSDNFKCVYFDWDVVLKDPGSLSLIEPDKTSRHSSDYFRIIHLERQMGRELPESCKKAVNEERPGFLDSPVCKITAE